MSDPSFSHVGLLIHADGTNGSTSFPDSSNSGHSTAFVQAASVSTANPKFGTGAGAFVTNSYISFLDSADWHFGSGQFTVEAWGYVTSATGDRNIIGVHSASEYPWGFKLGSAGTLAF